MFFHSRFTLLAPNLHQTYTDKGAIKMDNYQALGYLLLACKELDLDLETVKKLKGEMMYMFDMKTEEEAEEQGFDWYNHLDL